MYSSCSFAHASGTMIPRRCSRSQTSRKKIIVEKLGTAEKQESISAMQDAGKGKIRVPHSSYETGKGLTRRAWVVTLQ